MINEEKRNTTWHTSVVTAQILVIPRAGSVMLMLVVVVRMGQGVSFVSHVRLDLQLIARTDRVRTWIVLLIHQIGGSRLFPAVILKIFICVMMCGKIFVLFRSPHNRFRYPRCCRFHFFRWPMRESLRWRCRCSCLERTFLSLLICWFGYFVLEKKHKIFYNTDNIFAKG